MFDKSNPPSSGSAWSFQMAPLTPEEQAEYDKKLAEYEAREQAKELEQVLYHKALKGKGLRSPITATYTIVCTGCGLTLKKTLELNRETADDGSRDIWSPAIPDGWLQITPDWLDGDSYGFFHSHECYDKFLRRNGLDKQADEFKNAVWIA